MQFTLFLFVFSLHFSIIASQSIAVPITYQSGKYYFTLSFGKDKKSLSLPINTCSQYSFVTSTVFLPKSESTKTLLKFNFLHQELKYEGFHYNEFLTIFPTILVNNFHIFYLPIYDYEIQDDLQAIPFAFSFDDESFSLTHLLYKNNQIDKLSFTIINSKDFKNTKMIFGNLPSQYLNNVSIANIEVKSKFNTWGAELSYVFIDSISYVYKNTFYTNEQYAYFDSTIKGIHVPEDFYDFVMKNMFSDAVKEGKCKNVLFSERKFFACDREIIDSFPDLIFVFGNKGLKIPMKIMFEEYGITADVLILKNEIVKNTFAFGNYFLNQFIVNFNYDNSSISFISNFDNIIDVDINLLFPKRRLLFFGMIIFAIILLLFLFRYCRRRYIFHKKNIIKTKINLELSDNILI